MMLTADCRSKDCSQAIELVKVRIIESRRRDVLRPRPGIVNAHRRQHPINLKEIAPFERYAQFPSILRMSSDMKLGDSPHSSPVQPSLLADTWACRSCGEFFGFLRLQPAPGSCRS